MTDEPELIVVEPPDLGRDWRAEQERKREAVFGRYRDHLVQALAAGAPSPAPETLAQTILEVLFVWDDISTGARCGCSCHPRLAEGDLHDSGFACPCRKTAEERRAWWADWQTECDAYWDSPEGRRERAARQAEEDALALWLADAADVLVTSHGGWAPEQWSGTVEGHSFYFRERHDQWSIELDLVPTGHFYRVWIGGDLDEASSFETRESTRGEVIAEGTTNTEGYGASPVERAVFIVGTIRTHLRRRECHVHVSEAAELERSFGRPLAWCPACGIKLAAR
ncbi:MAG: hypothetical protein ACYDH6_14990 [Acidimicrobiales bacterium]